MRHHQGSNTSNAPVPLPLLAPTPPCSQSPPLPLQTRIMATDALQLAGRHVTWSTHESPCHSPPVCPSPFACSTPNVEIYVYLYLCSTQARAEGSRVGRIFMLWPMFVLFELYVAFSVSPLLPHCLLPYRVIRAFALMATQRHLLHLFSLIFFYFLQFN